MFKNKFSPAYLKLPVFEFTFVGPSEATPSTNFLKKLVPVFKISSSDITNYELLEAVAKTKKPVILSTGASNLGEINSAIKVLRISGCKKIIIFSRDELKQYELNESLSDIEKKR